LNQQAHGDIENNGNADQQRLIERELKAVNIERVAGVVISDELPRLRKLIFRITKGKSFMYSEQYIDTDDNNKSKSVYIITYYDGAHTRDRIFKVCDSMTGQRYNLPELSQMGSDIEKLKITIQNQQSVFYSTKGHLRQQLLDFDKNIGGEGSSTIYFYRMFVAKEKALY